MILTDCRVRNTRRPWNFSKTLWASRLKRKILLLLVFTFLFVGLADKVQTVILPVAAPYATTQNFRIFFFYRLVLLNLFFELVPGLHRVPITCLIPLLA